MRWLIVALALMLPPLDAGAAEALDIRGTTPAQVVLEPGQTSGRAALYGRGLNQLSGGEAYRDDVRAVDVRVTMGAPSPALRDVFITALPTAREGNYRVAARLGAQLVYLPLSVRITSPREASGRRAPDSGALDAARRNQDAAAAATAGRSGR